METDNQPMAPIMPARSYTQYNGFAMPMNYLDGSYLTATSYGHEFQTTLRGTKPIVRSRVAQFENTSLPELPPRPQATNTYDTNQGVFASTIPKVTGSYVVHPDWVSEKPAQRKAKPLRKL